MIDFPTPTLDEEFRACCVLLRQLAEAKRSGDAVAIWEALDDLDVFTLYAGPSRIRMRAAGEVTRHGFFEMQPPAVS